MSHNHQTTEPIVSPPDAAFEAEARRRGRLFWHRQYLGVLPIFGIGLLASAGFVGCFFLVPVRHSVLLLCLLLADVVGLFMACNWWMVRSARGLERLLTVACPTCGGLARCEAVALPDTHIYLICPQCHQRADTGFSVPYYRRLGARVSMFYNWQTRKKVLPQAIVRVRRPGKKRKLETRSDQ
jgi:hypothetical protein